ncbi:MAG: alpha/beta hydrolase [Chloroflexi bacterium]|nr:alpha/beta hydrolase [Chloroflexota bacterium]
MKKVALTAVAILILLVAAAAVYFWYRSSQPLYKPGMVSAAENLRGPLTPPAQTGDAEFWQVEEDIQLHHFAAGNGRNILIIHGGPGQPFTQPLPGLEPLTNEYQFHYYDQRGSGQSSRPIDTFSSNNYYENMTVLDQTLGLGAQIADIERIRQILGEEQLIIIGHSFGGFLASLYAAEFPQHVESLILIAPADVLVMPQESGGLFEEVRRKLPENMQAEYDAYLDEYLDFGNIFNKSEADLVQLNNQFAQYYEAVADVPALDQEQGKAGGWMTMAIYFSIGSRHDFRDALQVVDAPVLIVHGANDIQTEAASRIYVDAFANADFQIIEDAGHFSFVEQPEALATAVTDFLAQTK